MTKEFGLRVKYVTLVRILRDGFWRATGIMRTTGHVRTILGRGNITDKCHEMTITWNVNKQKEDEVRRCSWHRWGLRDRRCYICLRRFWEAGSGFCSKHHCVRQWFSNLCVHQNHLDDFLKHILWDPPPEFLIQYL